MSYVQVQHPNTRGLSLSGMGLGTYTMADYTAWTSAEVRDEINRFTNEVNGTNSDVGTHRNALIAAGADGTRFWNEWQVFLRDWAAYQASTRGGVTGGVFSSAVTNLRTLVDRYIVLDGRFRTMTGVAPTGRSGDSRPTSWWSQATEAAGSAPGLLLAAGLGVVGLIAVAVIATQARAFAQPALSAMRRNTRRRRRSR